MEGECIRPAIAKGSGIGGETCVEAGGGGRGYFPGGLLEYVKENARGGGDFGNDQVEFSVAGITDVVIDDHIDWLGPCQGFLT